MSLARAAFSLVAPPRCGACAASCERPPLCGACEHALARRRPLISPGPPGVNVAVAAGGFGDVARELILGLKLGRRLPLAEPAAEAMRAAAPAALLDRVTIVPVPADPLRRRWRGFDPAEAIARALARRAGLPLARCLARERGRRQVGRPRAQRLADPPRVRLRAAPPPVALLVDDVHTTGATLAACARALRAGGCRDVRALTLARAE